MNEVQNNNPTSEKEELTHSDKFVGVLTDPRPTFLKMSNLPAKTSDWLIPILVVIVLAILSNVLMMSNPAIRSQAIEKQMAIVEENFDMAVENGQISREGADRQLEQIRDNIDAQMNAGMIIQFVATFVIVFLIFFIVTGVFFLIAKFVFKDVGSYKSSLVSYGLPQYVIVLQLIVILIAAMATNTLIMGTGLAVLLDYDTSTFAGFLLNKIDPFRIWFYAVISIAYAKMFKSRSITKYAFAIFSLWIGVSIIVFFLSQSIPLLRPLAL